MKKLIAVATFLSFGAISTMLSASPVKTEHCDLARAKADMLLPDDHPKTQVVPNDQLQVVVTADVIQRSCCMPPNLVVGGKITNVSDRSIDYVRLHFAFEDRNGKVLDGESLYNHHAESLSDDAYVQKILNEKPHFDPIRPGQSDTFGFSIPCSELPVFSKVELFSNDVKR